MFFIWLGLLEVFFMFKFFEDGNVGDEIDFIVDFSEVIEGNVDDIVVSY